MRGFVPRSPAKGTGWATGCSQVGLLEPVIPAGEACRDALALRREQPPLFAPCARIKESRACWGHYVLGCACQNAIY